MPLTPERLTENVRELASRRGGHEKVRTLVAELLIHELGAASTDIRFEEAIPEAHGIADALLGRTIFEFKRDLKVERADAESQLLRYLRQKEQQAGRSYLGVATDGREFLAFELREIELVQVGATFRVDPNKPQDLVRWLDSAISVRSDLDPDGDTIQQELGRDSLTYAKARNAIEAMWTDVAEVPDVRLKRDLWARLLEQVYGSSVESDDLFFQHTYLTIVAKAMATIALTHEIPEPAALLSGQRFEETAIYGAVESDFFDWILAADGSHDLINRTVNTVARFRLRDVQTDVMKVLYESLIDPETRHELGEYYTPDWLASMVCDEAITDPLNQRVVDPACGSGTFVFHAVRKLLAAAEGAELTNGEAIRRATTQVFGIEIHPVAVIIARVTYLLALGPERLQGDRDEIRVPVYLGDSMQWNARLFFGGRRVGIPVPDGPPLQIPESIAEDPVVLDRVLETLIDSSERGDTVESLEHWLEQQGISEPRDIAAVTETFQSLKQLQREDRDGIWGYVIRNLSRPFWLSSEGHRADVLVGNPPWLPYRSMKGGWRAEFRDRSKDFGLWAGGKLATQQDLSGYFLVRSAERYMKPPGTIAFVMPRGVLNLKHYEGLRRLSGARPEDLALRGPTMRTPQTEGDAPLIQLRIEGAWDLEEVTPLFRVPSCVVFASIAAGTGLPLHLRVFSGRLHRFNAPRHEAIEELNVAEGPWPSAALLTGGSTYRGRFREGATIVPRRFWVVDRVQSSLGGSATAPLVQGRVGSKDKRPWTEVDPLRGNVEAEVLYPLYLGESVAPYRTLTPATSVLPLAIAERRVLGSAAAREAGLRRLADWLKRAEQHWAERSGSSLSMRERLDYHAGMTSQLPVSPTRVVYATSGTLPAAAVLADPRGIAESSLYWAAAEDRSEALYVCALINSQAALERIQVLQARGGFGPRHFHKLMWELPIQRYDASNTAHIELAVAAERAEEVAARVDAAGYFVTVRTRIREALAEDGIAAEIDRLVERLLEDAK